MFFVTNEKNGQIGHLDINTEDTTLSAWRMAIKNRPIKKGMLFHSDR